MANVAPRAAVEIAASDRPRRAPRMASGDRIREAAAALFLARGYQAVSMDEVAAAAGVSKQTIYTHFPSKAALFADLVLGNAARVEAFAAAIGPTVMAAADLERGLRTLARGYVRVVLRPEALRLRRLVLGEAGRFPELARAYRDAVPERGYQALERLLRDLRDEGRLAPDDPALAARQLAWLILGWPLDRAMFGDGDAAPDDADLDRWADAGVRVFLAAYPPPPASAG